MTTRRNGVPVMSEDEDPYLADICLDPHEEVNRAQDPAYADILQHLREKIIAHTRQAREPAFVPTYSDTGRGVN
jgi:hypothetical protein